MNNLVMARPVDEEPSIYQAIKAGNFNKEGFDLAKKFEETMSQVQKACEDIEMASRQGSAYKITSRVRRSLDDLMEEKSSSNPNNAKGVVGLVNRLRFEIIMLNRAALYCLERGNDSVELELEELYKYIEGTEEGSVIPATEEKKGPQKAKYLQLFKFMIGPTMDKFRRLTSSILEGALNKGYFGTSKGLSHLRALRNIDYIDRSYLMQKDCLSYEKDSLLFQGVSIPPCPVLTKMDLKWWEEFEESGFGQRLMIEPNYDACLEELSVGGTSFKLKGEIAKKILEKAKKNLAVHKNIRWIEESEDGCIIKTSIDHTFTFQDNELIVHQEGADASSRIDLTKSIDDPLHITVFNTICERCYNCNLNEVENKIEEEKVSEQENEEAERKKKAEERLKIIKEIKKYYIQDQGIEEEDFAALSGEQVELLLRLMYQEVKGGYSIYSENGSLIIQKCEDSYSASVIIKGSKKFMIAEEGKEEIPDSRVIILPILNHLCKNKMGMDLKDAVKLADPEEMLKTEQGALEFLQLCNKKRKAQLKSESKKPEPLESNTPTQGLTKDNVKEIADNIIRRLPVRSKAITVQIGSKEGDGYLTIHNKESETGMSSIQIPTKALEGEEATEIFRFTDPNHNCVKEEDIMTGKLENVKIQGQFILTPNSLAWDFLEECCQELNIGKITDFAQPSTTMSPETARKANAAKLQKKDVVSFIKGYWEEEGGDLITIRNTKKESIQLNGEQVIFAQGLNRKNIEYVLQDQESTAKLIDFLDDLCQFKDKRTMSQYLAQKEPRRQ